MTYEQPSVTPTARYPITAAARALGVSRSTLLRYVERGMITPAYKRTTHRKIFTGAQLIQLWKNNI